jgi:hypothetical protein
MKTIFDPASVRRTLIAGLKKPNPANPDVPMWTLEDLDEPSPGFLYCMNGANNHPKSFPKGYIGIQHRNLARDSTIRESVEFAPDAHDFPTASNDPNRPF